MCGVCSMVHRTHLHGTSLLKWLNVLALSSNSLFVDDGKAVREL